MGKYLNIGCDSFEAILKNEYVDKTGLIEYINNTIGTKRKLTCVSRPRRFGKTYALNMLAAYYAKGQDTKDLFENLEISKSEDFEKFLNKYNVISLDISTFLSIVQDKSDVTKFIERELIADLAEVYPEIAEKSILLDALVEINMKCSEKFIFIIDEWDAIFREQKDNTKLQEEYVEFLRGLFKSNQTDRICEAAYMTGILPIKKYGHQSAVSDFFEYTMVNPEPIERYFGFTGEEVEALCDKHHLNKQDVMKWYDGYLLGNEHIYNPKSVMESLYRRKIRNYWTKTETYETLKLYIDLNFDGLKDAIIDMLGGKPQKVDTESFQNDMTTFSSKDDVFTLLVHLGYLAYDFAERKVSIPNHEIREEFIRALKNCNRKELVKVIEKSDDILEATWKMDGESVGRIINEIHSLDTAHEFYNNEQALRSVIKMAYLSSVDYYIKLEELQAGYGYADVVFWPNKYIEKPLLIVELKWDQSAERALLQIKEKKYPDSVISWNGDILLVGINYDKDTRKHSCIIEKIIKS